MKVDVLILIKEGKYKEASKQLPVWIYDEKAERSFLLNEITSHTSFKTGTTTVSVHLKNYHEREVYSGTGGCEDDSCYGATIVSGSYQEGKTIQKKIDEFLKDTYVIDVEATPKQKQALKNFGEVVIKMSKREAQKLLSKLIDGIKKEKSYSRWDSSYLDDEFDAWKIPDECF